jgi:hypothetical protein
MGIIWEDSKGFFCCMCEGETNDNGENAKAIHKNCKLKEGVVIHGEGR